MARFRPASASHSRRCSIAVRTSKPRSREARSAACCPEAAAARERTKLESLAARLRELSPAFSDEFRALAAGDVCGLLLEIDLVRRRASPARFDCRLPRSPARGGDSVDSFTRRKRLVALRPVRTDAALVPGDFAVDVDDGTYELTLQTRLEAMLALHRIA